MHNDSYIQYISLCLLFNAFESYKFVISLHIPEGPKKPNAINLATKYNKLKPRGLSAMYQKKNI